MTDKPPFRGTFAPAAESARLPFRRSFYKAQRIGHAAAKRPLPKQAEGADLGAARRLAEQGGSPKLRFGDAVFAARKRRGCARCKLKGSEKPEGFAAGAGGSREDGPFGHGAVQTARYLSRDLP